MCVLRGERENERGQQFCSGRGSLTREGAGARVPQLLWDAETWQGLSIPAPALLSTTCQVRSGLVPEDGASLPEGSASRLAHSCDPAAGSQPPGFVWGLGRGLL